MRDWTGAAEIVGGLVADLDVTDDYSNYLSYAPH
jgi:hypothetical protein